MTARTYRTSIYKDVISSYRDFMFGGTRFFMGGVASKFSRAPTVDVQLPSGGVAAIRPKDSDFATLRQVFRDKNYAIDLPPMWKRVEDAYARILAAGEVPVIVDAGANIGAATIWFQQTFPKAMVLAIEPDPENAALLRKNLDRIDRTKVFEAAVGSQPGFVSVASADSSWAVTTERAEQGCPIVTIPEAVASVDRGRLFIAKIDIEGFESDLFSAGTEWLDDAAVVYIEPHDWMNPGTGSSRSFQKEMGVRPFEMLLSGENLVYVRL